MSSPIPPDPYAILGVSQTADLAAIRSAHRKLVLKHHPDRIKDEALREKGKDEFQKVQQAYELLSDPVKRSRYDDRVRLAELQKAAMNREPLSRSTTAPHQTWAAPAAAYTTHAPPSAAPREYREDGNFYEEFRQPKNPQPYDERYAYHEPMPRTSSRKYPEYEKRAPASKPAEKKSKAASAFATAATVAAFTSKLKAQAAEKSKTSKADEKRSDREKRRDRSEKISSRKSPYVDDYYSSDDSEVTEVRPSMKPASRSKTTTELPTRRASSRTEKTHHLEEETFDSKWESLHDEGKAYISKASNRPALDRTGSGAYKYWELNESRGRRSGSDSEKRPTSSKGRRGTAEDYFNTPTFTKSSSSPSHIRAHMEERAPRSTVGITRDRGDRDRDRDRDRERERDRDRERERDHERERERDRDRDRDRERERERERDRDREYRKPMPSVTRANTMPSPKSSSKKDSAPLKGSNLRSETAMHDSGYGSSSSPHTPEMREHSPPISAKPRHTSTTSTKYHVRNPEKETDEDILRAPRLGKKIDEHEDRYHQRYHSPEPILREPERRSRDRPERPKVETSRSKSSRGASLMQEFTVQPDSPIRRSESGRFEERPSPRSPHDTPTISRHNSGRDKGFVEISPDDREPDSRYTRPPPEKVNIAPRRDASAAKWATYRDTPERHSEYASRFRDPLPSRRPSVY